jgi:hypothetical protein
MILSFHCRLHIHNRDLIRDLVLQRAALKITTSLQQQLRINPFPRQISRELTAQAIFAELRGRVAKQEIECLEHF